MDLPLHRFGGFGKIGAAEAAAVFALGDVPREYQRATTIRAENTVPDSFYILVDGWVAASRTLPNGSQQIFKVYLPGDALGISSLCRQRSIEDLTTVTAATIVNVPTSRVVELFNKHPCMISHFILSLQSDCFTLMDHLVAIGRTSAQARLARLLLDLADRLTLIDLAKNDRFTLELTQVQMADIMGLTAVHLNRCVRDFIKRGFISKDGRTIAILDRRFLEELGSWSPRRPQNPDWLPTR